MAAFILFLAVASAGAWAVHRSWVREGGSKSLAVYRAALAATIAPLVVYKAGAVFDRNLLGFVGISYITFKAVQVLIEMRDGPVSYTHLDVYKRQRERRTGRWDGNTRRGRGYRT